MVRVSRFGWARSEKSRTRRTSHPGPRTSVRFGIIAGAIVIVFLVTWGTYLASNTTVEQIKVDGSYHADVKAVVDLSGVQPGDTLFAIDPTLVESRVARHNWVEHVSVTRWPTGTLAIGVKERVPVALVVGDDGLPLCYLDRDGVRLPIDTLALYDVPLLRGIDGALGAASKIDDEDTLELLSVLASLDPDSDGLISDVVLVGNFGFEIVTSPRRRSESIRVKLGRGEYEKKFARLGAFWEQAITGHPERNFEWIDLRFAGQVVTKET
jgi:cell division septal protein FtsQ